MNSQKHRSSHNLAKLYNKGTRIKYSFGVGIFNAKCDIVYATAMLDFTCSVIPCLCLYVFGQISPLSAEELPELQH
jgi:hypothetical protein